MTTDKMLKEKGRVSHARNRGNVLKDLYSKRMSEEVVEYRRRGLLAVQDSILENMQLDAENGNVDIKTLRWWSDALEMINTLLAKNANPSSILNTPAKRKIANEIAIYYRDNVQSEDDKDDNYTYQTLKSLVIGNMVGK
jgi:hypothetical protein